ncbi:MAG: hypothetical protein FWB80_06675 [Defluviitaleaceae bacterium]|nr:hypothetical protein [Defluviitaleaceae bacterium]
MKQIRFFKQLIDKSKHLLKGRDGASLIEGIVSILIFVVLVATVTMMIQVSMQISHSARETAASIQDEANEILRDVSIITPVDVAVFVLTIPDAAPINIEIAILESKDFNLKIFRPN